jgi:hypothetical protein
MGQPFELTQDQLDQVVHAGLSALEQQRQAAPAASPEAASSDESDPIDAVRQELAQLRQRLDASSYEQRVQSETARINQSLDAEVSKHEVFKDNPDLAEVGRKSALALLNHNPRMTEAEAMKAVANDFGKALNSKHEQWVRGKVADTASAEAGPGGEPTASPTPRAQTGQDLKLGRVRDKALRRVGAKELIT